MTGVASDYLERIQFFNGQRLFASDLQELEAFHREMRELHNRSLHQPGVGKGYAITAEKGDRKVTIGPGYAIDDVGHEIVNAASRQELVPPVESEPDGSSVFYDLTVSYPPDDQLEEAETRAGICLPRGVVRLREEPVFCWIRLVRNSEDKLVPRDAKLGLDIELGRKIRIGRIEIKNCQLESLSVSERRNARAATQPYVAAGKLSIYDANLEAQRLFQTIEIIRDEIASLDPAKTPTFERWGNLLDNQLTPVTERIAQTLSAKNGIPIDTSSGGFITTPSYHVRIEHSFLSVMAEAFLFSNSLQPLAGFGWNLSISNPSPTGFQATIDSAEVYRILANSGSPAPAFSSELLPSTIKDNLKDHPVFAFIDEALNSGSLVVFERALDLLEQLVLTITSTSVVWIGVE